MHTHTLLSIQQPVFHLKFQLPAAGKTVCLSVCPTLRSSVHPTSEDLPTAISSQLQSFFGLRHQHEAHSW